MREEEDNIIGYIEYLSDDGKIIGYVTPFTDVDKFRKEILKAAEVGMPITPVVFPDKLDKSLGLPRDIYWPGGFRKEKRHTYPYEIYQTNNRNFVFRNYAYAKTRMKAADYKLVYSGQMERWDEPEDIYIAHNQSNRPNKPLMESHYTAPCPTIKDLWMALNNQRDKRSKEIALALRIFATGSMQAFAQPTNVDMSNRLICFNIQSLGEQLKPVAMLSMLEYINTAVMSNERNDPKAATWVYFDEIYLLLRDSLSANFLYTSWKRFRKYNAYATGITQNVQDCLTNDTAYAMLANSEFVVMLRQTKDIDSVVELYGLSEPQRKYLLLAQPGEGIIKMGNSLIPFNNPQPKDTKTYKLLTTKPGEME